MTRKVVVTLTILMMVGSAVGYKRGTAPSLRYIDKIEANVPNLGNPTPLITPCDTFEPSAPDIRALLGSPGKNVAVKGDTVVAISGEYSGDPANIFNGVKAYYSFDGGNTWQSFYLSTTLCRRIYPGVIWPDAAGIQWTGSPSPLFFWHEARIEGGVYQPSKVYIAWDILWPSGIFWVIELPLSEEHNVWLPSADARGDMIVVTAFGFQSGLGFAWISNDGGNTWTIDTLSTTLTMDSPIPRIGSIPNYITAISEVYTSYPWGEALVPYFFESTDGGETWTAYNLWELAHGGNVPYDSCMGGWWYVYDYVLGAGDRPLIVWKYEKGQLEYGDVWFYKPTAGGPGNWQNWTYQLLVGNGNGDPIATQPYITIDPNTGMIFIVYNAYFILGGDTNNHIGVLGSEDEGTTWSLDTIWPGFDPFEEEAAELPVYSPSFNGLIPLHVTFCDRNLAPGDPLLHSGALAISVKENAYKLSSKSILLNVKKVDKDILVNFSLPYPSNVDISLYNLAGEKIATIYKGNESSGTIKYRASHLTKGVYFVKLLSSAGNSTAKLLLLK